MKTQNKFANHILLSSITASLLFSPLMALPSGGKFTHGTSGTINVNGNNMHIHGNKVNSVIQWGGGFNIGKGESVNFGGNNKNYLNIAHGTNKSTIEGLLNASGNNVFLINPNGVIITKTGTINANRFVASTSSMSNDDINKFANMNNFNDGLAFSPVFKPNKAGNVVNMGNINANDVLLIGNKVDLQGDVNGMHNDGVSKDTLKNSSNKANNKIHLVGNEVYILADKLKSKSIVVSAYSKGSLQQSLDSYYNSDKIDFSNKEYDNTENKGNKKLSIKDKIEKQATINSDVDWFYFAKGWNENKNDMRNFFDVYKLTSDIDFKANQGKNYANYCIDGLGCTSMIVGHTEAFTKTFDGRGFTLKNININIQDAQYNNIGIFGFASGANFKNINIDYMGGGINANSNREYINIGGFIGNSYKSNYSNISLSNIENISSSNSQSNSFAKIGGFVGYTDMSNFSNIHLDNIKNITSFNNKVVYIGGFVGDSDGSAYHNIYLSDIDKIDGKGLYGSSVGGFTGRSYGQNDKYSNISLDNIKIISGSSLNVNGDSYIGGFAGTAKLGQYSNIVLNNIGSIYSYGQGDTSSGGFTGDSYNGTYSNITLSNISNIYSDNQRAYAGGFAGRNLWGTYSNITLNNINNIYSYGVHAYSGGFAGDNEGSFSNISLNNINNIHSYAQYNAYSGGFVGMTYGQNDEYSNIVLNNITNIYSHGQYNAYSAGFAGYSASYKLNFSNIFIYFNPNVTIGTNNGNTNSNIFIDKNNNNNISFSNVHIYHKKGTLTNVTSDKNNLNDADNKIKIHTYTDDKQGYIDFEKAVLQSLAKEGLYKDKNGNLVFTKEFKIEKPSHLTNPTDFVDIEVNLEKDDVISADDLNKWLDEIFAGNYWVDIKDLDKIQGLSESIAQSISFLEALYGQEGMKEILNKFGDDYKKAYSKFDKLKTSKANLLAFINDKLKVLVNTSNEMLTELKITQEQLNIAIKSYNEYVKKINENPSLKNEETLNALKAEVERLDKLSQELAVAIASNQLKLENWQNKTHSDSKGQFAIKGNFEHAALFVPDLEEVVTNGNENNSYQKISRQIADTNKQTPVFEFEYEKLAEVEEASLKQTSRTCIVSDNFKTMNPCVVGSF